MTEPRSDPAGVTGQTAGQAAAEASSTVAQTVKDQASRVTDEVRIQTRGVASEIRDRVADQARTQNDQLAEGLRQMAGELQRMVGDRPDSPARTVVSRIAETGQQAADYLSKHGPEGVLAEVQDFARRRPGAFLATALVTGFVVGRVGKGVLAASPEPSTMEPRTGGLTTASVPLPAESGPWTSEYRGTGAETGVPAAMPATPTTPTTPSEAATYDRR